MVTDVIVSWPKSCEYPLWRQYIRDMRQHFNEILIAFTETNQEPDYREFIKNSMFADYVHFIDAPTPVGFEDWRNVAVNALLLHSYNAPWVWFTEQDFCPLDNFWPEVYRLEKEGYQVIAVYQGERMHPCCIFVTREVLNRTSKNFGIIPDVADHFGIFQQEIEKLGAKVGIIGKHAYKHYNGLSQNMTMLQRGETPNYQIEEFKKWLVDCKNVYVPVDPRFLDLCAKLI